jgi:hypothetical protein
MKRYHSNPSVCFLSNSSSGAWQVRGLQISQSRSYWTAINRPDKEDIEKFDIFCFIKKPNLKILDLVKSKNKIAVLDVVDSWAQPGDDLNIFNKDDAADLFRKKWKNLDFDGYIFPTKKMYEDIAPYGSFSTYIYHHYWPKLYTERNPPRRKVFKIGYQGNEDFMGTFINQINKLCLKYDIKFIVNPDNYCDLDVIILFRDGNRNSFLSTNYKSNIKVTNAYGAGIPMLVNKNEYVAHEVDNGNIYFFYDLLSFEIQLNNLFNYSLRKDISKSFVSDSKGYNIENIAKIYEYFFKRIKKV